MALSKLPACFGLTELQKCFFPHLFNTKENLNYSGPLPDTFFYTPDSMSTETRIEFLKWHREHKNNHFDFQEEIRIYCQ